LKGRRFIYRCKKERNKGAGEKKSDNQNPNTAKPDTLQLPHLRRSPTFYFYVPVQSTSDRRR
jgi:hypothetical protein